MMRALLLGLALLSGAAVAAGAAPATPPPQRGGVVYGEHHAAVLSAPPGWVFDSESGLDEGLQAVLYRTGETWKDSPGTMYAQGYDTPDGRAPDLEAFIADDLARTRAESPGVRTFLLTGFELPDHTPVRVVGYRGDRWGNVEAAAFLPQDKAVIVLALSARGRQRFERDLADFRRFVRSYRPMDVTIRRVGD